MKNIFGVVNFDKKETTLNKSFTLLIKEDGKLQKPKDNLLISFDGSIYNREYLKKELNIDKDLEDNILISIAFKSFGPALFQKIDGVFKLIVYDENSQILYLAKDRIGTQPLYFYEHNNSLIFGSSLKSFYNIPEFTKKIDKKALAIYLNYGYILQPYTIFEYTHKVKSAHYIEYDLKNRNYCQKEYWSLESYYEDKKPKLDEKDVISSVKNILYDSIQKRKEKEPFAVSLSGGYDSSIVTALLTQTSEKKVNTFTIGFDDKSINEAPYAKKIASYLNTNHHEHYFSVSDAKTVVPKLCEVFDEPFADYGAAPMIILTQLVKNSGFDSLFVGDGGDEIFATADDVKLFERIQKTPLTLKKNVYRFFNNIDFYKIPILNRYNNIPTKYYKFLQFLKATKISQMVKVKPMIFYENEIKNLLNDEFITFETTFDEINFSKNSEVVDQVIGSYFKTSMVDAELVKSFYTTKNAQINIKEPLLDIDLIKYMSNVSGALKIKDGCKKYILKEITHQYIPKDLLNRPKSGLNIPFSSWLNGPLKELLFAQINETRLKDDGLFDVKTILDIRDNFYKGHLSYKYKLWTIFIFQLWLENQKEVKV